jgi:hypothetical protein
MRTKTMMMMMVVVEVVTTTMIHAEANCLQTLCHIELM